MKKIKYRIEGTCYVDDKYTQEDMLSFNSSRMLPDDIKKAVEKSAFERKRNFHTTIIGDSTIDWKDKFFEQMEEIEKKWGVAVYNNVLRFLEESHKNKGHRFQTYMAHDIAKINSDSETVLFAFDQAMQKQIGNIAYVKKIIYTQNDKKQKMSNKAELIKEKSDGVIAKLMAYGDKN